MAEPSLQTMKRLWSVLDRTGKRSFGMLFFWSILTSLAELGLLATVAPFALALSSQSGKGTFFGGAQVSVQTAGLLFLIAIIVASALRLVVVRMQVRSTQAIAEYLCERSYSRTLNRPYIGHISTSTSQVIATLTSRLDIVLQGVIFSVTSGMGQLIMTLSIVTALFLTSAWVTAILLISVIGAYALFLFRSRAIVRRESQRHNKAISQVARVLSESLVGIRDVILSGNQATWLRAFREAQHDLRDAKARSTVTAATPRIVIEAVGFIVIVAIACTLAATTSSAARPVSILAVVVLGSQRLLPVAHGLYLSWNGFKSGLPHLREVLPLLEQADCAHPPADRALPLRHKLELRDLHYAYSGADAPVLDGVNLTVQAGSTIGIVGRTGCGKSTLLDLVMGLLDPQKGELVIDGVPLSKENVPQWQRSIAHVAQNIYLADATIAENIALASPGAAIDLAAMREAAMLAEMSDFIEALPLGYETEVGERGIRLSGGQRQRIGIARALYRRSDVLILDEATSSLDEETERNVMRGVSTWAEARTILIVSHRLSILKACDEIYRMTGGRLEGPIAYSDLARGDRADRDEVLRE